MRKAQIVIVEQALENFREGLLRAVGAFFFFGAFLLLQIFRRDLYLRLCSFDSRLSKRLGLPSRYTKAWQRFAEGRGARIFWSVLVGLLFLVAVGNAWGYLYVRQKLKQLSTNSLTKSVQMTFGPHIDVPGS